MASERPDPAAREDVRVVRGGAAGDPVRDVREAWLAAHNAGDARALARHFTDDAVMLPAGAPAITGTAAIEEYLRSDFAGGVSTVTLLSSVVHVTGELAVEWAEYEARPAASPDAPGRRGKYVIAYRRAADGTWRIQVDIWNADG